MTPDERLTVMTARQHGLTTRSQLRGVGFTSGMIGHRIASGRLVELSPQVLKIAGTPDTPLLRVRAATLDAGRDGCASHDTAAALWGIPRFELEPVHVWRVRGRSNHPDRLGVQHTTRRLMPSHVLLVDGIPTTTPTRTLVDKAADLEPWEVERFMEDTWLMGLTNFHLIDRMLCSLSKQGRTGLTIVRRLLDVRGPDYRPAESNLERRALAILEESGVGPFRRQVDLADEAGWIGRVDLHHRFLPLVVEVQSDRFHGALLDRRRDAARIRRLERAGYVVVEVREHAVWHEPRSVIDVVAAGRERAHWARALSRAA